jgi:hypothetical protein
MNDSPLGTFRVEKHAGEHKDFGLSDDDPYPLRGVTYPCDYGDIEGYTGEDEANLDFFMGKDGDKFGFIKVSRPELSDGEHKFYARLTGEEVAAVRAAFAPVIIEHVSFQSEKDLLLAIEPFQNKIQL